MSSSDEFGRLEVVLDRSWEVQPVTWSSLTWWDPLPCGQDLLKTLSNPEPPPFPSPALSVMGHPPTPRRRLAPTHLKFASSASPSPIPKMGQRYSWCDQVSYSSSPLAYPLPSSADDSQFYNSVFLHSETSPSFDASKTPNSVSPRYNCSSPKYPNPIPNQVQDHNIIYPTPPDSMHRHHSMSRSQLYKRPGNKFSFSKASVLRGQCYSMLTPPMHNQETGGGPGYISRNSSLGLPVADGNTSYY